MSNLLQVPALVMLEGCHRVGKSSLLGTLCKRTSYADCYMDRGIASNYAFNVLFGRPQFDLHTAWTHYFANPAACVLHFSLAMQDFAADIAADAARREAWVGAIVDYDNARLDELIAYAVDSASSIAPERVLSVQARSLPVDELAEHVLAWLATFRQARGKYS